MKWSVSACCQIVRLLKVWEESVHCLWYCIYSWNAVCFYTCQSFTKRKLFDRVQVTSHKQSFSVGSHVESAFAFSGLGFVCPSISSRSWGHCLVFQSCCGCCFDTGSWAWGFKQAIRCPSASEKGCRDHWREKTQVRRFQSLQPATLSWFLILHCSQSRLYGLLILVDSCVFKMPQLSSFCGQIFLQKVALQQGRPVSRACLVSWHTIQTWLAHSHTAVHPWLFALSSKTKIWMTLDLAPLMQNHCLHFRISLCQVRAETGRLETATFLTGRKCGLFDPCRVAHVHGRVDCHSQTHRILELLVWGLSVFKRHLMAFLRFWHTEAYGGIIYTEPLWPRFKSLSLKPLEVEISLVQTTMTTSPPFRVLNLDGSEPSNSDLLWRQK